MTARWPLDPEAAAILADCAANPPSRRWAHTHDTLDGGKIYGWRYSRRDKRVKALDEICERAILETSKIDSAQAREECGLTVDEALEAAASAPAIGIAA